MRYLVIKRVYDFFFALAALILLSPVFLVFIILIKATSKGPVIYSQKRFGRNKKFFYIYKFRSMRVDAPTDVPTHLLKDPDTWNTKVGGFLRKTSMDELPQLLNILKGDMSFIGPRPALWNQDDLIELRDRFNANDVPVGLTGWAQVNGRDDIPLEEKARLDGEYASEIGFVMDLKCFVKTVGVILKIKDVV